MSTEPPDWRRSVARVGFVGSDRSGTAFCIGGHHFVTALHVVAVDRRAEPLDVLPGIRLTLHDAQGQETTLGAGLVPGFWSAAGDWAVLRSDVAPAVPAIPCAPAPRSGDEWQAFGFPAYESRAQGTHFSGSIEYAQALLKDGDLRVPVLQLNCRQAAAGSGVALDGLSGAPCMVGGGAAGLLVSTPFEVWHDGSRMAHKQTQAGTVYATRSQALLDWQRERGRAVLEGSWAPEDVGAPDLARDLEGQDFVVFLSSQEPADGAGVGLRLRDVAETAYASLSRTRLTAPCFVAAADALASPAALDAVVRALCRSKVVVFDATGFEPAVMFLAGIRAVCRRGVTLLSVGGGFRLGEDLGVPFNLKDANLVVHSTAQDSAIEGDSVKLMVARIRRGLREAASTLYQDLPVYEAIRLLPPDRRSLIPREEGVLLLCPFDAAYEPTWTGLLKPGLGYQLDLAREAFEEGGLLPPKTRPDVGVARSFELNSPRLVTQAVYEHIRRMEICVVDLSLWKPNVLFELGVRLAATRLRTVCVLQADSLAALDPALRPQGERLVDLLVGGQGLYRPGMTWQSQKSFFEEVYGLSTEVGGRRELQPRPHGLLGDHRIHTTVQQAVDIAQEPASQPVSDLLLARAELFSRQTVAGSNTPAGLFPENPAMNAREREADFEHLVAACLYLGYRLGSAQARADPVLLQALKRALNQLDARHGAGSAAGGDDFLARNPSLRRRLERLRRLITPTRPTP